VKVNAVPLMVVGTGVVRAIGVKIVKSDQSALRAGTTNIVHVINAVV